MKTATLPSVRVNPQLRDAFETVLQKGETLSNRLEHALRAEVHVRRYRQALIARGLASAVTARENNDYVSKAELTLGPTPLIRIIGQNELPGGHAGY